MTCRRIAPFTFLLLAATTGAAEPDFSQVPGVVVAHTPASSNIYFGSPGIAMLSAGVYLAKCDEFGPGSSEHQSAVSHVFLSEDHGLTWRPVARIDGLFWASIFTHRRAVYLLGPDKHHGRLVVLRSDDGGHTWTKPTDGDHGLLTSEGEFHTAPMPVVAHQGRLWRGRRRDGRHALGRTLPSRHVERPAGGQSTRAR